MNSQIEENSNEIQILKGCDCPFIIKYFDDCIHREQITSYSCIVTEYCKVKTKYRMSH